MLWSKKENDEAMTQKSGSKNEVSKGTYEKLWGEIDDEPEIDTSIANIKPADMLIPKPYKLSCAHDDTPDHPFLRPPTSCKGSNTILHAIDLLRHNQEIQSQKMKLQKRIIKTKGDCEIPKLPPAPNEFCQQLPDASNLTKSSVIKLTEVPSISEQTANVLLKKSAASILCHVGFASADSDALDALSENLCSYLKKFSQELRCQQDNFLMGHKTSHTDVFEATLYENKIRGYEEFIRFAKSCVIDYTLKLDDRRQTIEAEYEILSKTPYHSARSIPVHFPRVNTVDLLKGDFEPEPSSPNIVTEHDTEAISRDVFMHEPNGIFYH